MATSQITSVPMWLTGCTYDSTGGNDLRNSGVTALAYPAGPAGGSSVGVLAGVLGTGLAVSAASGMNIHVQGGSFLAANPTAANGGYTATLASQATLTVAASDPVNPRIDLVCGTVVDNGNSSSYGMVQIVTGTPASSPAAPSTPASSVRLAYITVPALAGSVVSGDLEDVRSYTCAVGGIVGQPIEYNPPGYNGCYGYDAPSDRLYHNAASGVRQPRILPFAPQQVMIPYTNPVGGPGVGALQITDGDLTIVTDGATDIEVTYCIPGISMATPATAQVKFTIILDSTQIHETDVFTYSIDEAGISGHGFTAVYHTSSLAGDTPSAGTHTVALMGYTASANTTNVVSSAGRMGYLRVEPVTL